MRVALAVLLLSATGAVLAHPGHADPITISRATSATIPQLVAPYLRLHEALAGARFDAPAVAAAGDLRQIAEDARDKESDPSGKRMYRAVGSIAAHMEKAGDVATAQRLFSDLNDALLPFFDSWPNYLKAQDAVIYVCKSSERWWMQKRGPAALPYDGGMEACGELVHTKKEE